MNNSKLTEQMIKDIKLARKTIKRHERIGIPQVERCIRIADIHLHSILWFSGEAVHYRPDLEIED